MGHGGKHCAGHAKGGVESDGDLVLPFGEGSFQERLAIGGLAGLRHAGVVHQNVDAAGAGEYGIDETLHVGFDGEIGDEGKNFFAVGVEFASAGVNAIGGRSNNDAHAGGIQSPGDGKTDAFGASGAGNDGGLLVQG